MWRGNPIASQPKIFMIFFHEKLLSDVFNARRRRREGKLFVEVSDPVFRQKKPDPGLCTQYEGRFFKFQRMNIEKNKSPESGFKQKPDPNPIFSPARATEKFAKNVSFDMSKKRIRKLNVKRQLSRYSVNSPHKARLHVLYVQEVVTHFIQ